MGGSAGWLLSVLFGVAAIYFLFRILVARSGIDRIHNGAHLVMSVVMLAMPWSWYDAIPAALQIVFFTAAAGWYVYLLLFLPRAGAAAEVGDHRRGWLVWYHAAMMTAMVWMAVAMTARTPSPVMGMSGMDHAQHLQGNGGAQMMTGMQPWAVPISWGAGIFFAVLAVWFLGWFIAQASRFSSRPPAVASTGLADTGSYVLMAAGMATAFLVLMV